MGQITKYLSHDEICAVYTCLEGHIHVRFRSLDITMEPEEFSQLTSVLFDAIKILRKANKPNNEEINLEDLEVLPKV
ncbi:hypothetical protein JT359_05545 [Candidatus Poribacteria bacterium]|nr:hypothetical protein [Candidatus Poribacteria bacterium]